MGLQNFKTSTSFQGLIISLENEKMLVICIYMYSFSPNVFKGHFLKRIVGTEITRALTERDHTPYQRIVIGLGHRMENGLVRVALDKIVSMDRWSDMKIAYAQLHKHTNIMCKFQSSTCKNVGVMLWITMI